MNRSALLSFLLCIGFVFHGLSQKGPFEDDEIKSRYLKGTYANTESPSGINGSPFLDKTFQPGLLFFEGHSPVQALLRYDVVKEEIQVFMEQDKYSVIQDKVTVRIANKDFKKFNFKDKKGNLLVGYFEVLTPQNENKDVVLLEKPSKKIREGQEAGAMRPATQSQYVDKSELYLKFPDSKLAVISERKPKKFLNLFPDAHKGDVKNYMDKNSLKPKNESDLKKILQYYNSNF